MMTANTQNIIKVLIVDDEDDVLLLLEKILEPEGYEILKANTSNKAMKIMSSDPADVIIADYIMPGMSGIDLLKKIKT